MKKQFILFAIFFTLASCVHINSDITPSECVLDTTEKFSFGWYNRRAYEIEPCLLSLDNGIEDEFPQSANWDSLLAWEDKFHQAIIEECQSRDL